MVLQKVIQYILLWGISILVLSHSLLAQDNNSSLNVTCYIGTDYVHGRLGEYVYYYNRTISRLDWNIDSMYVMAYGIELNYWYFMLSFKQTLGFEHAIGTMDDSDWLDDNNPYIKTNYSHHDNYLESSNYTDGFIGLHLAVHKFTIQPGYGFKYIQYTMSARDGYLEYPPGSPRIYMLGTGIVYKQQYYIPYAGLKVNFAPLNEITLSGSVHASNIVLAKDTDNHVLRYIVFHDTFQNCRYIALSCGINYLFNHIGVYLSYQHEYIPETKGNGYWVEYGLLKSLTYKEIAGIKLSLHTIEAGINYRFSL